jgi:hypothetical protein
MFFTALFLLPFSVYEYKIKGMLYLRLFIVTSPETALRMPLP